MNERLVNERDWRMSRAEQIACPLIAWDGSEGCCRWCGVELTGRRTAWCSDEHVAEFERQHNFSYGRQWAILRDNWTCQRCDRSPLALGLWHELHGFYPYFYRPPSPSGSTEGGYANAALALEVNHIEPVRGTRTMGCWNHLENLETLCHQCHVAVTRLQIVSARAFGGSRTIACWEGLHDQCWATDEIKACVDGCHAAPSNSFSASGSVRPSRSGPATKLSDHGRALVATYARQAFLGKGTLDEPVMVAMTFRMPVPKRLPAVAAEHPATPPDLDKLVRAVLDALTQGRVIRDDPLVVEIYARKRYVKGTEKPGVRIECWRIGDLDHEAVRISGVVA